MSDDVQGLVEKFHMEYGFPVCVELGPVAPTDHDGDRALELIAEHLEDAMNLASEFIPTDLRLARMQILLEEFTELCSALVYRDKVETAKSLADLIYAGYGTGVAYGIPVKPCLEEVHRSNMTKDKDGSYRPRKGEDYRPPNIERVLDGHVQQS